MNRRGVLAAATVLGLATMLPARAAAAGIKPAPSPIPKKPAPNPVGVRSTATDVAHVLFVSAHPDDETLMSGVALAEHFAAGLDVHVLLLTNGEASGVLAALNGTGTNPWWAVPHNPADEGYSTLTATEMADARVREFANAVAALHTGEPSTMTLHFAGLPDGGVTEAAAQAAIQAVCDDIAPDDPWRLKGHTDLVDLHPDHLACGHAIRALQTGTPERFSDCRYYVNSLHWSDPLLTQVSHSWDLPTDSTISGRAINACRAYMAWAPQQGMYAVGAHSEAPMLTTIIATPKCLQHT